MIRSAAISSGPTLAAWPRRRRLQADHPPANRRAGWRPIATGSGRRQRPTAEGRGDPGMMHNARTRPTFRRLPWTCNCGVGVRW
jgi:hypothetical protein